MLIFGRNPIIEALRSDKTVAKVYFRFGSHGESVGEISRLLRAAKVPSVVLPKQKFDRLGGGSNTQGIAALIEDVAVVSLDDLLAVKREQDPPFFVALDSINDPHNMGAIIRTAECAGAHGVIIPARDSAMITDTVVKSSAGAVSHIPIARVTNLRHALDEIKKAGIWIAGLDGNGDTDLFQLDGSMPVCVLIGGEGKGLRPTIKSSCDFVVRIPMWGQIDSLNASVAAALALYEVRRKRI